MPKVVFIKEKRELEVPEGANLRDEAVKAGIQVNFEAIDTPTGFLGRYLNCRGLGLCGTCRVLVKKTDDGRYEFAQAGFESAEVRTEGNRSFTGEEHLWILRANRPRPSLAVPRN